MDRQADVLVCVKGNASDLQDRIEKHLNRRAKTVLRAEDVDYGHGRIERRSIELAPVLPWQTQWPHTHMACRITRERERIRDGETVGTSTETAIYVGSFAADVHAPERVLGLVGQLEVLGLAGQLDTLR